MEPSIWPDALNKFSQLTPWVQAIVIVSASSAWLGMWYFLKEAVRALSGLGHKNDRPDSFL